MQTETILSQHTFKEQSAAWLHELESRKRKPVAPSTLRAFNSYVRRLLPLVGPDTSLSEINNGFVRGLVTRLVAEELSAKTIGELIAAVKQIVASAVDADGNYLYPRQWNANFLDLPQITNQKQPCVTRAEVERCIKESRNDQERLLYAVLAGTGLRISEALAIHVSGNELQTSWDGDAAAILVRSMVYQGAELQRVKTQAARRTVDLDSRLNDLIAEFVFKNNIQAGQFLFQSRNGGPMNLKTATDRLKKYGVNGFHAFRRFRTTRLRERAIPEDIIRLWLGHSGQSISDRYSKLAQNVEIRKKYAGSDEAGLGFDIRLAGTRGDPRPGITKKKLKAKPKMLDALNIDRAAEPAFTASNEDLDPYFYSTPVAVEGD
jgi:integrase